ncbi:ribosome modulation factor [Motilimonas cestriensis]|uniref:ribosome modulation factor n=1 Tax=Motilimonas cestriensis TaxID=2742685 RepID=UPI003DA54BB6
MKRQKRDCLARAHAKGYHAGVLGRAKEVCPFQQVDAKSSWLGGWRDAYEERSHGLFMK